MLVPFDFGMPFIADARMKRVVILGMLFSLVGAGLTPGIITAFIGIPFLALGLALLAAGVGKMVWPYIQTQKVVEIPAIRTAVEFHVSASMIFDEERACSRKGESTGR